MTLALRAIGCANVRFGIHAPRSVRGFAASGMTSLYGGFR